MQRQHVAGRLHRLHRLLHARGHAASLERLRVLRRVAVAQRQEREHELRAVHVERLAGVALAERDRPEILDEGHRPARLKLRLVVVLVEADLARVDLAGAGVELRGPGEQVGLLLVRQVARADDVQEVERAIVLARQVARADVLAVHRVVEIAQVALGVDVGEARVGNAHLDVGIGAGAAPLGAEGQQDVAGLEESALAEARRKPRALGDDEAQADVALRLDAVGVAELDELVGRLDVGQLRPGAFRHGEIDGDLQLLGEIGVRLLVVGEFGGAGRVRSGSDEHGGAAGSRDGKLDLQRHWKRLPQTVLRLLA